MSEGFAVIERWLMEFDFHQRALVDLLNQHHRPDQRRVLVDLSPNLRAKGMIEDGCLIARALVEHGAVPVAKSGATA